MHSEIDIILGCKEGKGQFQKQLVVHYSPILMTIANRYCIDEPSAKDVLQDSFIKILRSIVNYQEVGSFVGWMKKIVINTALQSRSRKRFSFEISGLEGRDNIEDKPEIYNQLEAEEIIKVINKLPDGFRTIFNLYAIEGFSHQEIGELLNISASTSRSQFSRARKLLQNHLIKLNKLTA